MGRGPSIHFLEQNIFFLRKIGVNERWHSTKRVTKNIQEEGRTAIIVIPSQKFVSALFSVTESFLPGFSWSPDNITASNKKTASKSLSLCEITIIYLHKLFIIPLLCQYPLFIHTSVFMHKLFIIPLRCQYPLFIHTSVSKNELMALMSNDTIFYLLWYNVIRWNSHTYKKSSFLSLHGLLFLVNNTREVIELKLRKCDTA